MPAQQIEGQFRDIQRNGKNGFVHFVFRTAFQQAPRVIQDREQPQQKAERVGLREKSSVNLVDFEAGCPTFLANRETPTNGNISRGYQQYVDDACQPREMFPFFCD